ncbi:MAG: 3-methyl-2-oxobutanoate hydroxymethyltransferase [Gammaproteobacteria bacterium]|nr:3-methyl-2-oxobutanoate hydroxymethyltransferase [Gammaproteobacteria bacterium]
MPKTTLHSLTRLKQEGTKATCVTSYDASFTQRINQAGIDIILVGDSLGMVLQGHDSTLPVSMEQMVYHTRCVQAGNNTALIMADMPFMSYRTVEQAMTNATDLMQAGAQIVKLEGGLWLKDTVNKLLEQGIPVCAHLGLTPQAVNKLGGYRVQGKTPEQAASLLNEAVELEAAGASMILLECVPTHLGKAITAAVSVPVIGIGAGPDTDAQVLVLYDLLGITPSKPARFVKDYLLQEGTVLSALEAYVTEVKNHQFPAPEHCFN